MPSLPPDEAVVIEVRGDAGSARTVAASCSEVLGEGRCRAEEAPLEPTAAHWYVVVVFANDGGARASIELRRTTSTESVASREVRFAPDDSPEERHRAAGLIAAAQVLALEPELRRKPEPAPEPDPEPTTPAEEPPPPRAPPRLWGLDVGVFAGPVLDRGAPRFGVGARPFVPVIGPLLVEVGLSASMRPDEPDLYAGSASLGLGLALTPKSAELEVRAHVAFVAQEVVASARDDATGDRDRSSAFQLGPAAGASLAWPAEARVSFVLGAEVAALRPRFRIELRGRNAGRQPAATWIGSAGARLSF